MDDRSGVRRAALLLVSLVACSEPGAVPADSSPDAETPFEAAPDAGAGDTGVIPPDKKDAATTDAGPPRDGGLVIDDAGAADAGMSPCPDGDEGCLCGLGGACNNPGLVCLDSSGGLVAPQDRLFLCVRTCTSDDDCSTSPVGNTLCRPVFGGSTGCVSRDVGEGELADISRLRQVPMTGCEPGLIGIPPFVGLLIETDQVSCGRPCDPNTPSGPNACAPAFPYCNPGILNSQTTPGLCMARRAGPGDTCSRSSVIGLCDRSATDSLVCVGIPYSIDDPADPSANKDPGMCMETCDLSAPDCSASDDPGAGPAVCRQINMANPTGGVCSNECSWFPSECARPGAFGAGSTCTRELVFEMGYPLTFCFNVMTPPIAEWDFTNPPLEPCLTATGAESRCEAGTVCGDDGSGGVCVRTCTSSLTPSGCEATSANNHTCNDAVFTGDGDFKGACTPP